MCMQAMWAGTLGLRSSLLNTDIRQSAITSNSAAKYYVGLPRTPETAVETWRLLKVLWYQH